MQFSAVIAQECSIRTTTLFLSHSAHHWFVEVPVHAEEQIRSFPKLKRLSAVCSNKADTAGHRLRLRFLRKLKDVLGDDFDWFGRGVRDLGHRRLDGLANYHYHLALENGRVPHYWTEKLADACTCQIAIRSLGSTEYH